MSLRALRIGVAAVAGVALPAVAFALTCGETVVGVEVLTADLQCPSGHGLLLGSGAALDCDGHSIAGARQPGQYGVYVRDASDATVRGCVVHDFEVGIRLRGAVRAAIDENVARDNTRYGIEITQDSTHALVWRNEIYTNGDEGMHVSGPATADGDHQILENALDGNALEGIYVLGSHGNAIAGNTIQNHGAAGIYVKESWRNSLAENLLIDDPLQLVSGSELNVLSGNVIIGRKLKFDGSSRNYGYGIRVEAQGGTPSSAFDFVNGSSGNRIVDAEAIDPVDHHVKASGGSVGNTLVRLDAVPELRCSIEIGSSVTVTDVDGNPLPCAAPSVTPTTSTTTTTTTSTTQPPVKQTVEVRVSASEDDAEERSSGSVKLTSSDLELVYDKSDQTVGMRFRGVDVPQGANITAAHVQFQVDEKTSGTTSLVVRGQDDDDPPAFRNSRYDVSSRDQTTASVAWAPPPWTSTGAAGTEQRTPDLSAIVREIVERDGWSPGNAMVIVITGAGERVAEAYDGDSSGAPLLHVEY